MNYIELFVYNGIDAGVDDAFRDPGRILRKKIFVPIFRAGYIDRTCPCIDVV